MYRKTLTSDSLSKHAFLGEKLPITPLTKVVIVANDRHGHCAPVQAAGVAGRPYVLMDGFPPKPLSVAVSDTSLQEAGLINAAVTLRWS